MGVTVLVSSSGRDDLAGRKNRGIGELVADDAEESVPVLEYPRLWEYRLIGQSVERLREVIAHVLGRQEHTIEPGNTSRGGRYVSISVVVTVRDEAHRNEIFQGMQGHADVRMVL
jgi:putative lipoic acid-binding regulatory protein